MSNLSILQRLENKFEDFSQGKITNYEFKDYLVNSIDALEAMDYKEVQTAKDFQFKFEVAGFQDEQPKFESIDKVKESFRLWLQTLKHNYH